MVDEYIRKADAVEALDGKIIVTGHKNADTVLQYMKDISNKIKSLKPADVVQVVRCENYVHWSDSNQCERPELAGNRWHDDKYFETLPDDFCSYGERKED